MQFNLKQHEQWGVFALKVVAVSIAVVAFLDLTEGVLRGPFQASQFNGGRILTMWLTWCVDFRYLFEQFILAGAIVFAGSRFIDARSVFMIGFDKLDSDKMRFKGPDEDNVVWVGHRYGSKMEAEVVASTIESRLRESVT